MPKATGVSFGGASKYDIERRKKMAAALMEQGKQPEKTEIVSGWAVPQSPLAGLAKALQTGLGGYQEAKASEMEQQRQDSARQAMADAMGAYSRSQDTTPTQLKNGEQINWNQPSLDKSGQMYANMLMQNEDTAPMGMQAMQNNMELAQRAARENELMKQKQAFDLQMFDKNAALQNQITPYQQAQLDLEKQKIANVAAGGGGSKVWQDAQNIVAASESMGQPMDLMTAYGIAKSGLGVGRTMQDGIVSPMQGSVDAGGMMKYGETSGVEQAKSDAAARAANPQAQANAQYMTNLIEGMVGNEATGQAPHAGLSMAVGAESILPTIAGTEQANFISRLDQVGGAQFLQAFETLKGGGQITEIEGTKATNAIARMQRSQSDKDFIAAANEFKGIVQQAADRARTASQRTYQPVMSPNMMNTPSSPQNIGAQGQGSNPAITAPVDQIKPRLKFNPATGEFE